MSSSTDRITKYASPNKYDVRHVPYSFLDKRELKFNNKSTSQLNGIESYSILTSKKINVQNAISHSKSYDHGISFKSNNNPKRFRANQPKWIDSNQYDHFRSDNEKEKSASDTTATTTPPITERVRHKSLGLSRSSVKTSPLSILDDNYNSLHLQRITKSGINSRKNSTMNSTSSLSNESTKCFMTSRCSGRCCEEKPYKSPSKRVLDKQRGDTSSYRNQIKPKTRINIESASETTHKTVIVCPENFSYISKSITMPEMNTSQELSGDIGTNIPTSKSMSINPIRERKNFKSGPNFVSSIERHALVYLGFDDLLETAETAEELDSIAAAIGFYVERDENSTKNIPNDLHSFQKNSQTRSQASYQHPKITGNKRSLSSESRGMFKGFIRNISPKNLSRIKSQETFKVSPDIKIKNQLEVQIEDPFTLDSKLAQFYSPSIDTIRSQNSIESPGNNYNLNTIPDVQESNSSSLSTPNIPSFNINPPCYLNASISAFGYTLTKDTPNFPDLLNSQHRTLNT